MLSLAYQRDVMSELAAFNAAFDELSETIDGLGQSAEAVGAAPWRTRYQAAAREFAAAVDGLMADDAPAEARQATAALRQVRKESRRLLRAIDRAVEGQSASFAVAAEHSQGLKLAIAQVMADLRTCPSAKRRRSVCQGKRAVRLPLAPDGIPN
jgi:hypothetical protein